MRSKIRQYTVYGTLVNEFGSYKAAEEATGVCRRSISGVARRLPKCHTAGGFLWRFEGDDEVATGDINAGKSGRDSVVRQYTLDGEFVAEFASISAASEKTGIARTSISEVCSRVPHHVTAGGYLWRYAASDDLLFADSVSVELGHSVKCQQVDKDGKVIATYRSMADACRATGLSKGSVAKCCRGEAKAVKGIRLERC